MVNFEHNVVLAPMTSFKLGGPAEFFYRAKTAELAIAAIQAAQAKGWSYVVLSGLTNVLVSDQGVKGLVVKMENDNLKIDAGLTRLDEMRGKSGRRSEAYWRSTVSTQRAFNKADRQTRKSYDGSKVTVGAAVSMAIMAQKTVQVGLTGFEWAIGVPGKIGGAIYGNAGCFGRDISLNLRRVQALNPSGELSWLEVVDCQLGYRDSFFKHQTGWVILSAEFEFEYGDQAQSQQKLQTYLERRREKQPQGTFSAGSMFTNPTLDSLPESVRQSAMEAGVIARLTRLDEMRGKSSLRSEAYWRSTVSKQRAFNKADRQMRKSYIGQSRVPAGWLIDIAGLKGHTIGGVQISEKHGNFFLNLGHGTAEQMVILISFAKQQIRDKLGVQLQEEVQYIGF